LSPAAISGLKQIKTSWRPALSKLSNWILGDKGRGEKGRKGMELDHVWEETDAPVVQAFYRADKQSQIAEGN